MRTSGQTSRVLDGNLTEVGKVGTLIQASIPATTPLSVPNPEDSASQGLPPIHAAVELTFLLGSASSEHMRDLHSLYASQIATIVWNTDSMGLQESNRRNVIIGIALRKSEDKRDGVSEREREVFLQVMSMIQDLLL